MLLNSDEVARTLDLEYTAELAAAGAGAAPVMWLHIGADGTTLRTQLAESSGVEELDRAAASVASVMRFSPAYNRERPVAVWIQMPIRFEVPN
jgi:TonB family protein